MVLRSCGGEQYRKNLMIPAILPRHPADAPAEEICIWISAMPGVLAYLRTGRLGSAMNMIQAGNERSPRGRRANTARNSSASRSLNEEVHILIDLETRSGVTIRSDFAASFYNLRPARRTSHPSVAQPRRRDHYLQGANTVRSKSNSTTGFSVPPATFTTGATATRRSNLET